jgi:hypothetical protein
MNYNDTKHDEIRKDPTTLDQGLGVSNLAFFSVLDASASESALRLAVVVSSGAFFFFLTTIDVRSLTTAGVEPDDPAVVPLSSLSKDCAAKVGAVASRDSFGEVFSSSTF